ncbi:MAG TPA: type II toxin-antitoxin system prevent-host-death family antitoxin [Acidobacteria bacterium]|nr:type II toxin-antitoxin system prevent-host-death family antitoxin [Acidobacteriota bacterium]
MTRIGIKELKARLSEYVERARAGEMVVVTDRGKPVAELVPLSPTKLRLLELADAGELSWEGGGKPKGLRGIVIRGEPISDTIIRDRR